MREITIADVVPCMTIRIGPDVFFVHRAGAPRWRGRRPVCRKLTLRCAITVGTVSKDKIVRWLAIRDPVELIQAPQGDKP